MFRCDTAGREANLYRHIALLGCFATILAVGFDPFVQNLIRYYPVSVPDAEQTANIANTSMFTALGTQRGGSCKTTRIYLLNSKAKILKFTASTQL